MARAGKHGVSLKYLQNFATQLAAAVRFGDVVLLSGPMGAGKTTFAGFLLGALGVERPTEGSPSFPIHHEYTATIEQDGSAERGTAQLTKAGSVSHLDLYRIDEERELEDRGLLEVLFNRDRLVLVEWLDKFPQLLKTLEETVRRDPSRAVLKIALDFEEGPNAYGSDSSLLRSLYVRGTGDSERVQAILIFLSTIPEK